MAAATAAANAGEDALVIVSADELARGSGAESEAATEQSTAIVFSCRVDRRGSLA